VWSSAGEILAQVIDDGGSARGPLLSPFRDPTFIGENFAAVFDGTAYVALLHDGTALQMRRIQPSGVLGVTRTVDATPRDVSGLDATFDGEDIIVAWSERKPGPGTDGDVFAYRVDPMTGAVGDVVTIAATTRDETSPALAPSSPTRVLVAYQVDEPRGVVARRSVEVVVLGAERARGEPCRLDADCENNICQDGRCLEELPTYPPDEDGGEEPTDAAPQPTSGCAAAQVSSPLAPLLLAAAVWRVAKRRRVV
jgi:hypothetical protein